jgi:hypothetical protein
MREFSEGDEIWVPFLFAHGYILQLGEHLPGFKSASYAKVELWDGWREEWNIFNVMLHRIEHRNMPLRLPRYTGKTLKATCEKCGEVTTFIINA